MTRAILERLPEALREPRPLRMATPDGFRLLIDRDLPFMLVARSADARRRAPAHDAGSGTSAPRAPSLAARIASAGAVHALWVRDSPADDTPERLVRCIAEVMRARFGTGLLLIEIRDLDDPVGIVPGSELVPPFQIEVASAGLPSETGVLSALTGALRRIRIDYRTPTVRNLGDPSSSAGLRGARDRLGALGGPGPLSGIARISIGLPAIHVAADGSRFYPESLHRMEAAVIDAVLRAAWDYARAVLDPVDPASRLVAGRHHRSLGRRALDAAARTVDRQLTAIASAFELLIDLTPVNSAEAEADFRRGGGVAAPTFRYRPLAVSPGDLKRALYSINIGRIEDPVLEDLFYEKQREIDQQLTMLQLRESPRFKDASRVLHGSVSGGLLATAWSIIRDIRDRGSRGKTPDIARGATGPAIPEGASMSPDMVDAEAIRSAAEATIARYRERWSDFDATVHLREDLPAGLMVSGPRLLISTRSRMRASRLDALLEHEIGVHLLTYFNGNAQGLRVFRSGLAGYEQIQEGLAVLAEFATGGTGVERLRLLAARVVGVHAMQTGATFVETARLLTSDAGLDDAEAFHVALRVYRAGGLSKDAIYLQGLEQVLQHLAGGGDLDTLWIGKIAAHHIGVVQELVARGMLAAPRLRPRFVETGRGMDFIRRAAAGTRLTDLLTEDA